MKQETIKNQIIKGSEKAGKTYAFDDTHDENTPAQMWFQESETGKILFIVFYTQACRWARCQGCNLPSRMASDHVSYKALIAQIDHLFSQPEVAEQANSIKKVIISNNGSVLDEETFSSTALMYLIAKLNLTLPNLAILSMETRPEYVELEELEFISRSLAEGETPTTLELAIGFEAFDDKIRNEVFDKGLSLDIFERFAAQVALYGFKLKCYFMLKPVPGMSNESAVSDIHRAIDYLSQVSEQNNLDINIHLNPTYVSTGTVLEKQFHNGEYVPPELSDLVKAALHAENKSVSLFLGLSDEGLAVPGGSFLRKGDDGLVDKLEEFNRTQDFEVLRKATARMA